MNQKNTTPTNERTLFSTDVSSVFVVHNSRKRPFIEQFEYSSVNFTQKDLGTILGFFIVRDDSSTSENIVNFLASEVKKQYFLPNDKPVDQKFESTLHRVNRALEEVANLGNVSWMGSIEGVVCVIEGNSIHFSVTGDAHILLLRNDTLIDISEGLASQEAANYPLKTFVDISSGEINPHDKIIITSRELLELISMEELQKNAARMGERGFLQFIETALTNECPLASTTIIDITPTEQKDPITPIQHKEVPENFFGGNILEKEDEDYKITEDADIDLDELTEDVPKEYTDPRTGHIHIQGEDTEFEKQHALTPLKERASDAFEAFKDYSHKKRRHITKKIISRTDDSHETSYDTGQQKVSFTTILRSLWERVSDATKRTYNIISRATKKSLDLFVRSLKKAYISTRERIISLKREKVIDERYSYTYSQNFTPEEPKRKLLPHIRKIIKLWSSMETKTKFMAIGILVIVVVLPLLFSFMSPENVPVQQEQVEVSEETSQAISESEPIEEPMVQNTISNPEIVFQGEQVLQTFVLREVPITVEATSIRTFAGAQEQGFALPDDAGEVVHATAMDDLNLVFFVTDTNKMYSFSPIAQSFQEQQNIPEINHTTIKALSTYLTYLYILTDDTITRHTRVENGFDDGIPWLEDEIDLSSVTSFMINEEIFIAQNNDIIKLASGQRERYTKDAAIENVSLIYTTEDMDYVWVIDQPNMSLYKTDKENGSVIDSYIHTELANARSFSVNEDLEAVFVANESDAVVKFDLQ